MRRDLKLLREILLAAEAGEKVAVVSERLGVPAETLRRHAFNAAQGALVEATDPWQPTWKGQEVLELVRDEQRFTAARERVRERTGGENLGMILRDLEYPASLDDAALAGVARQLSDEVQRRGCIGPSETTAAPEPSVPVAVSEEVIP